MPGKVSSRISSERFRAFLAAILLDMASLHYKDDIAENAGNLCLVKDLFLEHVVYGDNDYSTDSPRLDSSRDISTALPSLFTAGLAASMAANTSSFRE